MNNFSELNNEQVESRLAHVAPNECGEDINPDAYHGGPDPVAALVDEADGLPGDDVSEFDGEPHNDDECGPLPGEDMDGDHASALASAGFGTDEDYGYFGGDGE